MEHSMSKQNVRTLIVEDNDDLRDVMELHLGEAGYETLTADGRAALLPDDLPERLRVGNHAASVLNQARENRMTLRQLEQTYVVEILRRADGDKSRAAEMLGLDRKTLYRKLEECREVGLLDET
jgi:DNA-binding NtrC family response regulator